MKAKSPRPHEVQEPLLPSLQRSLERHLNRFPHPHRACSCMTIEKGKVKIATRFIANAGAWSHLAEGVTLGDAFKAVRHQLTRDLDRLEVDPALEKCGLGVVGACGSHACANMGRCPNRVETSSFVEVARIDPKDTEK